MLIQVVPHGGNFKASCGGLWEVGSTIAEAMGKLVISLAADKQLELVINPEAAELQQRKLGTELRERAQR